MADNTEAKFILNFESALAEIAKLGAAYDPPNPIAVLATMEAKHVQGRDLKTGHTRHAAVEEDKRNSREDLFNPDCAIELFLRLCRSMCGKAPLFR